MNPKQEITLVVTNVSHYAPVTRERQPKSTLETTKKNLMLSTMCKIVGVLQNYLVVEIQNGSIYYSKTLT